MTSSSSVPTSSTIKIATSIGITTAAVATSYLLYRKWRTSSNKHDEEQQPPQPITISQVNVYPVKGLRGMSVNEWVIGERGFLYDRAWMVVSRNQGTETDAEYKFVTQRQIPRMCLVGATVDLESETLTLYKANEGEDSEEKKFVLDFKKYLSDDKRVKAEIWKGVFDAVDMGDEVAQWLSSAIQKEGLRLVMTPQDLNRQPKPVVIQSILSETTDEDLKPMTQTSFADGFPYLISTENSLKDLNKRLSKQVDSRRFRPNITVAYNSSLQPFEEELWKRFQIAPKESESTEATDSEKNEPIEMYNVKICTRCSVPNVDPDTAKRDEKGPSYLLSQYHNGRISSQPVFGINVMHSQNSLNKIIRVGDVITVVSKYDQTPEFE